MPVTLMMKMYVIRYLYWLSPVSCNMVAVIFVGDIFDVQRYIVCV